MRNTIPKKEEVKELSSDKIKRLVFLRYLELLKKIQEEQQKKLLKRRRPTWVTFGQKQLLPQLNKDPMLKNLFFRLSPQGRLAMLETIFELNRQLQQLFNTFNNLQNVPNPQQSLDPVQQVLINQQIIEAMNRQNAVIQNAQDIEAQNNIVNTQTNAAQNDAAAETAMAEEAAAGLALTNFDNELNQKTEGEAENESQLAAPQPRPSNSSEEKEEKDETKEVEKEAIFETALKKFDAFKKEGGKELLEEAVKGITKGAGVESSKSAFTPRPTFAKY